jgi:hypothetical protein
VKFIFLLLLCANVLAGPKADDYSQFDRGYGIKEIEQILREQGAHFHGEGPDTDNPGKKRWYFDYPAYHGVPIVMIVDAFPTQAQLQAANTAALGEAVFVYRWLQGTGAVQ